MQTLRWTVRLNPQRHDGWGNIQDGVGEFLRDSDNLSADRADDCLALLVPVQEMPFFGGERGHPGGIYLHFRHPQLRGGLVFRHEWSYYCADQRSHAGPLQLLQPHRRWHARHHVTIHALRVTFQTISFLAEAIVFVYLGVSTVYYFLT